MKRREIKNAWPYRKKRALKRRKAEIIPLHTLERYSAIFNHLTDAVLVSRPRQRGIPGKYIQVNDEACRMYGFSRKEFTRLTYLDLDANPITDADYRERKKRLLSKGYFLFDTTHTTKDGKIIPVEVHMHMADFGDGPMMISIVHDITMRRQTEAALRKSKQKYFNIFESIQDVYYEVAFDGKILEMSPSIQEISGFRREQLIGRSIQDIYADPSDRQAFLTRLQKEGKVTDYELFLKDKDGTRKWASISAKLERDDQGSPARIVGSLRNISERKRVEQSLSEKEAQMRAILDATIDRIRYVDKDMRIIWANKTMGAMVGMSSEELVGRRCYELFFDSETPCVGCPTLKAAKTHRPERAVMHHSWIKGIDRDTYWDAYSVPIRNDHGGDIEGFIQIARDISEMKKTMETLRLKEETLRAILTASPAGIGLVQEGRILNWANEALCKMLGYDEKSLLGKNARELYPDDEEYGRVGDALYGGMIKKGRIESLETRWVTKDSRIIDVYLQGDALDPSDLSKGIIITARDITERKRVEARIHGLSQQLMKVQEDERRKISRYLHDSIAQDLSAVKMGCDSFSEKQKKLPADVRLKFSQFSEMLQNAISAVRDMSYTLRPPVLDELGLLQAFKKCCDEFSEKNHIHIDFYSAGMKNLRFESDIEINLYRLLQEALTNVERHSHARKVTIRLVASFPNIVLRIRDDGRGFDVKNRLVHTLKEKRMGLQIMQERARLLGGTLTILSTPMKGTHIIAKVPFKDKQNGSKTKGISD